MNQRPKYFQRYTGTLILASRGGGACLAVGRLAVHGPLPSVAGPRRLDGGRRGGHGDDGPPPALADLRPPGDPPAIQNTRNARAEPAGEPPCEMACGSQGGHTT